MLTVIGIIYGISILGVIGIYLSEETFPSYYDEECYMCNSSSPCQKNCPIKQ